MDTVEFEDCRLKSSTIAGIFLNKNVVTISLTSSTVLYVKHYASIEEAQKAYAKACTLISE